MASETYQTRLMYRNKRSTPITLVVEPWAVEYPVAPESSVEVVISGVSDQPAVWLDDEGERVIVQVEYPGINYEVWQSGERLD